MALKTRWKRCSAFQFQFLRCLLIFSVWRWWNMSHTESSVACLPQHYTDTTHMCSDPLSSPSDVQSRAAGICSPSARAPVKLTPAVVSVDQFMPRWWMGLKSLYRPDEFLHTRLRNTVLCRLHFMRSGVGKDVPHCLKCDCVMWHWVSLKGPKNSSSHSPL